MRTVFCPQCRFVRIPDGMTVDAAMTAHAQSAHGDYSTAPSVTLPLRDVLDWFMSCDPWASGLGIGQRIVAALEAQAEVRGYTQGWDEMYHDERLTLTEAPAPVGADMTDGTVFVEPDHASEMVQPGVHMTRDELEDIFPPDPHGDVI